MTATHKLKCLVTAAQKPRSVSKLPRDCGTPTRLTETWRPGSKAEDCTLRVTWLNSTPESNAWPNLGRALIQNLTNTVGSLPRCCWCSPSHRPCFGLCPEEFSAKPKAALTEEFPSPGRSGWKPSRGYFAKTIYVSWHWRYWILVNHCSDRAQWGILCILSKAEASKWYLAQDPTPWWPYGASGYFGAIYVECEEYHCVAIYFHYAPSFLRGTFFLIQNLINAVSELGPISMQSAFPPSRKSTKQPFFWLAPRAKTFAPTKKIRRQIQENPGKKANTAFNAKKLCDYRNANL